MHSIGSRLKVWRDALALKQSEAAERIGLPGSTYQNYERDVRAPNTEGWEGFARAGINANWLLTGEGPMLVADLVKAAPSDSSPRINDDALVQAVCVSIQTAKPGEALEKSVRRAVAFYKYCWDQGLITETGEGEGNLKSTA